MKYICLIGFIAILFTGCASHTPSTVINRSPSASSTSDDWRPNTYTVKKGDTLYSIGLEHGYDYREIAAVNNIHAPFTIKVGQKLNFANLNSKSSTDDEKLGAYENEDGVIISPVDTDIGPQTSAEVETAPVSPAVPPALNEPKATREPYSLEALNRKATTEPPPTATPDKIVKTPETKPTETATKTKPVVVDGVAWAWPTQGKVSARFNTTSNKGINIAGKKGQAITAASAGKVIYTGADLRGYGKLVIIKHSKTLLSVYAHNSVINVKEGQIVKSGQKIAEMGNTGTNSVKLHFEIRQKGKSIDPERFLPKS